MTIPLYDIAVIGSGFGGSLLAMIARRLGLTVLLLERGQHPRFAIGESTSPLTNLLLEEIAQSYDLPHLLPLTSYGPWQRTYPELGCGLKRGFTFYHHTAGQPFIARHDRANQLLVAASPHDELADTHWLRADVDQFLMREAVSLGAEYHDNVNLSPPEWQSDGTATLQAPGFQARTRFIIDATGPRGFLHHALNLSETTFADYPHTQALFSHFSGVRRSDSLPAFQSDETPPYPPDDAALHHVFDGGWIWVLRFGNGTTSAGVAITDTLAQDLSLSDGEAAWHRLLARFPSIAEQFADAEPTRPFVHSPRLSFRTSHAAGPGWAMLPSAAAFVDPLFSTGFPLTLLGITRLGRILGEHWDTNALNAQLTDYSTATLAEADTVADLISGCYAGMTDFPVFSSLSMFYFAAASFSEMARRLQSPHAPRHFLAADNKQFSAGLRQSAAQARVGKTLKGEQVASRVAPLNIAGLCNERKRYWYGVDLGDIIRGADKLGLRPEDVRTTLQTAPWAQIPGD